MASARASGEPSNRSAQQRGRSRHETHDDRAAPKTSDVVAYASDYRVYPTFRLSWRQSGLSSYKTYKIAVVLSGHPRMSWGREQDASRFSSTLC